MNLSKKKNLAAKVLNVGKERIIFITGRLMEIKEAITKQDIRDLKNDGAIRIKPIKGNKKKVLKRKRGMGKIKKRVVKRKKRYIVLTRKLRRYTNEMKNQGKIGDKELKEIRKRIRNKTFRSKNSLREYLGGRRWNH